MLRFATLTAFGKNAFQFRATTDVSAADATLKLDKI